MRKLEKDARDHNADDIRDWYVIGLIAIVSALFAWLPLLGRGRL